MGKENYIKGEEKDTRDIYKGVRSCVKWKRDFRGIILKRRVRYLLSSSLYIILSYFTKKSTIITKL